MPLNLDAFYARLNPSLGRRGGHGLITDIFTTLQGRNYRLGDHPLVHLPVLGDVVMDSLTDTMSDALRQNPYWPVVTGASREGFFAYRNPRQKGRVDIGNAEFYAPFVEYYADQREGIGPVRRWMEQILPGRLRENVAAQCATLWANPALRGRGGTRARGAFTPTGRRRAPVLRQRSIAQARGASDARRAAR